VFDMGRFVSFPLLLLRWTVSYIVIFLSQQATAVIENNPSSFLPKKLQSWCHYWNLYYMC